MPLWLLFQNSKTIAVLDRCKEPGSAGEPLFQDVLTAVTESVMAGKSTLPKISVALWFIF